MTLTTRQRAVLDAIVRYWTEHGIGPGIRDLCDALDISSPNGVAVHLKSLAEKGCIEWGHGAARQIWPAGLRAKIQDAARSLEVAA